MNLLEIIDKLQKQVGQLTEANERLINTIAARNEELYQYKIKYGPLTSEGYNRKLRILHKAEDRKS